jgi:carbonic anhydrase/acetyltransferase-like protein (isoleucine patch superfamily)
VPEFEFAGKRPRVHAEAYVAPTAVLIGDVEVGARASVWFGAVLRGDQNLIQVGEGSNIQDNAVVHCSDELPTVIGSGVTVGHNALLEGCVVEEGALVGTGSIMLQRSRLGRRAMLAAGAVLGEGKEVPEGQLAAGIPAEVKRAVSGAAAEHWMGRPAHHYQEMGREYRERLVRLTQ